MLQVLSSESVRLRIALNIHALYGGGAERLMAQLARRWSGQHQVHVVTWSSADTDAYPIPSTVVRHGLNVQSDSRHLWQGLINNRHRVRLLQAALQEIAPDFILSFADQMNIVTLAASRPLQAQGIPVWIAEHSDPAHQRLSRAWEFWRRRVYPRCTGCVVLTPGIATFLSRLIDPARLRVIPPGIELPPAVGPELDQSPSGKQRILFVGRMSSEKRVDLLIEAWRSLHAELPEWHVTLVGDGPLRATLEEQARNLPRIEFTGWEREPSRRYREAQVFVLCSDYEGFPVALLEALSHGVACIATQCTTAMQMLQAEAGEECLTLVPTGSAEGVATAIRQLASQPDLRTRMGQFGRHAVQAYTWQRVGRQWDAVLPCAGDT